MLSENSTQRMIDALTRTNVYTHEEAEGAPPARRITIAVSRQVGSQGVSLARLVGERLGWPVFDRELLQQIAEQTGARVRLLETLDEKRSSWVSDFVETFFSMTPVSESVYFRHLLQTISSLGSRGECIIVGRGAAQFLPPDMTLRVRAVADREDRIAFIQAQQGGTHDEVARWIDHTEKERRRFILDHFHKDPENPLVHDLVINTSRFSLEDCAEIVLTGVRAMQGRPARKSSPATQPVAAAPAT